LSTTRSEATFIPLCVPEIRGNEWEYVKECLDTNWVSSVGSYVDRFEDEFAGVIGVNHAVATVNGTAALHVSLLVAGVQPDDEVVVSTLTFVSPANAIRYAGAWPVFIDAEPNFFQMDPNVLSDFFNNECTWSNGELRNNKSGRKVSAIVAVHILGHPVDMDPITELASKFSLVVIEDATESLGAKYKDKPLGSIGHIACFSFNGNKLLTTGGGGMLVTNDPALAKRARHLTTQAKAEPIEYIHDDIGYNYRLTNVLAAIGVAQLESIEEYIAAKRRIAANYLDGLASSEGIATMPEADWANSVSWLYTILVDPDQFRMDSRELMNALGEQRIQSRPLWQPIHQSPAHQGSQYHGGTTAETLYKHALSLPCSVGLTADEQDRVIKEILNAHN
jgi:perosamine synthetase